MKPFAILFLIAMSIALVVTYLQDAVKYTDTDIALNTLEKKFSEGEYKKIEINGNKAIATVSGATVKVN
jgi:hypothetical protein